MEFKKIIVIGILSTNKLFPQTNVCNEIRLGVILREVRTENTILSKNSFVILNHILKNCFIFQG